jgi:hypothetical protein
MPFVNSVIKTAHDKDTVTAQKARQIAVIAGSDPHTLFELYNHRAITIEDKHEIIDNIVAESSLTVSTAAHIIPAGIRESVGGDTNALVGLTLAVGAGAYGYKKGVHTALYDKSARTVNSVKDWWTPERVIHREGTKDNPYTGTRSGLFGQQPYPPAEKAKAAAKEAAAVAAHAKKGEKKAEKKANKGGVWYNPMDIAETWQTHGPEYLTAEKATKKKVADALKATQVTQDKAIADIKAANAEAHGKTWTGMIENKWFDVQQGLSNAKTHGNTYASRLITNPFEWSDKEGGKEGEKSWMPQFKQRVGTGLWKKDEPANYAESKAVFYTQASTIAVIGLLAVCVNSAHSKRSNVGRILRGEAGPVLDPIQEMHLTNGGRYTGNLKDDATLHKLFKNSDKNHESIEEVRYRLLSEWKSSLFGRNVLNIKHLVRNDGSLRDTVEEIANAIQYHFSLMSYGTRAAHSIKNLFGRRSSSHSYLQSRKSKSKRSRSSHRSSKSSKRSAKGHSPRSRKR